MKIYCVTDENGKTRTVVADGEPHAMDLVARERGAIDIADLAQNSDIDDPIAEWEIDAIGPEDAEYYWATDKGEIVYRRVGCQHGDGQTDSDDNPVYLDSGPADGEDDNVLNLGALDDVTIG